MVTVTIIVQGCVVNGINFKGLLHDILLYDMLDPIAHLGGRLTLEGWSRIINPNINLLKYA